MFNIFRPHIRFALYHTRPFDQECIKGSPRRPLDKHYSPPSALGHMVIARKFAERAMPAKKSSQCRKLGWKWIFTTGPFQIDKQLKVVLISIQCQHPHMHKQCCWRKWLRGTTCYRTHPNRFHSLIFAYKEGVSAKENVIAADVLDSSLGPKWNLKPVSCFRISEYSRRRGWNSDG